MENIKAKFFLLRYRLNNNDKKLYLKLYISIFFFLLFIFTTVIFLFNPFIKIKNAYVDKFASISNKITENKKELVTSKQGNNSTYIRPVDGVITSGYGYRQGGFHTGIDVACYNHRDNVYSVADGVVIFTGSQSGYGNVVEIEHNINGKKIYSFYAHLSKIRVSVGQNVKKTQIIANEGGDPYYDPNPGNSTGHHLHFELRTSSGYGNDINPTFIFN